MNTSFKPGGIWLDTDGKRIQAHGASIFRIGEKYFLYGENKENTDGKNGIWHWGVRYYSSNDLYNWKDEGLLIPPVSDKPDSTLAPDSCMDRPHIVYCGHSGKYVCWLKIMEKDGIQDMTVLTAERFQGPYTVAHEHLRPAGMSTGDFDIATDGDGRAYMYFERVHSELICVRLTRDYTGFTDEYGSHFPHPEGPPFVREAPCHFERDGKHYLITSGTSGYYPNPSEIAVSDSFEGPFEVLGSPHVGDETGTSFHSQISSVFKVPGKDNLYIALADRWLPECGNITYADELEVIGCIKSKDFAKLAALKQRLRLPDAENTSAADYVWLPLVFENGLPLIRWHDEWRIEDF